MDTTTAVGVADLIAELWGVERGENWSSFYAATIADLDKQDAMKAIRDLFARQSRCPTPLEVVEAAGGQTPVSEPSDQWALVMAVNEGYGEPKALTKISRGVLSVMGGFESIPTDYEKRRWFERDFIDKYRDAMIRPTSLPAIGPTKLVELPELKDA